MKTQVQKRDFGILLPPLRLQGRLQERRIGLTISIGQEFPAPRLTSLPSSLKRPNFVFQPRKLLKRSLLHIGYLQPLVS